MDSDTDTDPPVAHKAAADGDVPLLVQAIKRDPGALQQRDREGMYTVIESRKHYESKPIKYSEIFFSCKIENFQLKNFGIFLIFAQNIDCGYTLEPPPQSMFWSKNKKSRYTPASEVQGGIYYTDMFS